MSQNKEFVKDSTELAITNIEYLSKLINLCRQYNVKVFLIRSPLHEKSASFQNEQIFKEKLSDDFSNFEFLDFSKFPLSNSEFGDLEHLNYRGANIFSRWFDNLLKKGILNKTYKQLIIDEEIKVRTPINGL